MPTKSDTSKSSFPGSTMKHPSVFGNFVTRVGHLLTAASQSNNLPKPKQRPSSSNNCEAVDKTKNITTSEPSSARLPANTVDKKPALIVTETAVENRINNNGNGGSAEKEEINPPTVVSNNGGDYAERSRKKLLRNPSIASRDSEASSANNTPILFRKYSSNVSLRIRNMVSGRLGSSNNNNNKNGQSDRNGLKPTSYTPVPVRRFNTTVERHNSLRANYKNNASSGVSSNNNNNNNSGDNAVLRRFLTTNRAGRLRRSISSDPIVQQNAFARMKQAALERGENLTEVNEATERMANSGMAFSQLARKIAEREKNKRWYQW